MSVEAGVISAIASAAGTEVLDRLKNDKQGIPVLIKPKPSKFLNSKLIRFTAVSKQTDTIQGQIRNPLDEDAIIKNISIIPDSSFKTNGILKIKVNDARVFSNDTSTDFTDVPILDIAIPEGKLIERNKTIDFYAVGSGNVTVFVQFDKLEK